MDIYFGRWEHWADRRFWEMGAPSEKKVGAGRFGEKKWEIGRFRPPPPSGASEVIRVK